MKKVFLFQRQILVNIDIVGHTPGKEKRSLKLISKDQQNLLENKFKINSKSTKSKLRDLAYDLAQTFVVHFLMKD